MTVGSPLGLMVSFAVPLLLGNLFQQLYNMADAAIVGRYLGPNALAGVGVSSSVQFLVIGFCLGVCSGFGICVAQRFGARDMGDMRRYVFHSLVLTAAIALVVTTATAILTPQILHLLNTPEDIYKEAYDYLFVIFLGIPFIMLYNVLSAVLRAVGDSRTPFIFLVICTALNIGLDIFCIVVLKMGVLGASVATVTAQAVSGILCGIVIIRNFEILRIRPEDRRLDREHFIRLTVMAVPMGLQFSITAIGSMVMQAANNSLGSVYVSGFTAGMKIKQLAMCPFDALANAVATFAGQNYGAGRIDRIKKGFFEGLAMGVGYGLLIGVVLYFFGRDMSMLFVEAKETAVLDAAGLYLARLGLFYWALGILNVARMTTQGLGFAGRTIFSGTMEMIARIVMAVVFVPKYAYDAITWSDQVAWCAGIIYILPMCIICIGKIAKKLRGDKMSALQAGH
ncbi:MAG: MATE family efflux transporter [Lachnospiraceae bacterium]|nr:MATE family efflux transporter [Lachnospiraceae bacterium]